MVEVEGGDGALAAWGGWGVAHGRGGRIGDCAVAAISGTVGVGAVARLFLSRIFWPRVI